MVVLPASMCAHDADIAIALQRILAGHSCFLKRLSGAAGSADRPPHIVTIVNDRKTSRDLGLPTGPQSVTSDNARKARLASAMRCVSSRFFTALPRLLAASISSPERRADMVVFRTPARRGDQPAESPAPGHARGALRPAPDRSPRQQRAAADLDLRLHIVERHHVGTAGSDRPWPWLPPWAMAPINDLFGDSLFSRRA